jgi:transcriptional regulator with XRE-family HTH domain
MMTVEASKTRIRFAREQASLSQTELAERTKISRNHLRRIENGETDPGIARCRRIALALGTTIDQLWPVDEVEVELDEAA